MSENTVVFIVGLGLTGLAYLLYPHPFAWVTGVPGAVLLFAGIWPECNDR